MKKRIVSLILITVFTLCMSLPAAADENTETNDHEVSVFEAADMMSSEADEDKTGYDGFIFKVSDDVIESVCTDADIDVVDESAGLAKAESLQAIEQSVPEEKIEYIEPDYTLELFSDDEPDDEYYSQQWDIDELNVKTLWKAGIEGQDLDDSVDLDYDGDKLDDDIIVAVIDSGLNMDHEDIDSSRVVAGWNFVNNSASVKDSIGHGTFVAGEIMAIKDNAVGIAGIGQNIKVMPLKTFDSKTSTVSTAVLGIRYAAEQRSLFDSTQGKEGTDISVLNISFGGSSDSKTLKEAIDAAIDAGIIVICASGNDGNTTATYPAQYAIGVGSVGMGNSVSSFSQRLSADNGDGYENKVWVCAPGENMISSYGSGYKTTKGTSFAAPLVSALAAICKGLDNSLDHESFKELLKNASSYVNSGLGTIEGQDVGCGWGCIDFANTVNTLMGFELEQSGTDGVSNTAAKNGNWYYYKDGILDLEYTGIRPNENGWWRVVNGKVDFSCNTVEYNENGWWYCRGGQVQFDYTGIAPNQYGWWRIVNGRVDFDCNTVEYNENGWWYCRGGQVQFDYTGIAPNQYGWWRIVNGRVDFDCNTVEHNEYGWWYCLGGKVQFDYNGVAPNQYGWWKITGGAVDFSYTGYASNAYGTWWISNGKVVF